MVAPGFNYAAERFGLLAQGVAFPDRAEVDASARAFA